MTQIFSLLVYAQEIQTYIHAKTCALMFILLFIPIYKTGNNPTVH